MSRAALLMCATLLGIAGCQHKAVERSSLAYVPHVHPATQEDVLAIPEDDSEPALFRTLDETFGRPGTVADGVYRLVTPRADLSVTVDEMDVPTAAFLESDFRFWRCPCGKLLVNGQFVVTDYETNDVVDELQNGGLHIVAIAPLMLFERPRLMMIRFQGEGRPRTLAAGLKSALGYTGEARRQPVRPNLEAAVTG